MSQIEAVSKKIINIAHDTLLMNLRFLEVAMSSLEWEAIEGSGQIACDGMKIYYDPVLVIRKYKVDQHSIARLYLHIILHMVFHHNFEYSEKDTRLWDYSCDIAVENTIEDLNLYHVADKKSEERQIKLKTLKDRAGGLTAQKLYRLLLVEQPSDDEEAQLAKLFHADEHVHWTTPENYEISFEQWKKISERIKADLKSFSKDKTNSEALNQSLEEATREKINYADFLRRFMAMGEDIHINDDEFDYIYYTYGLKTYGNMPLVEPLEYQDIKKIKEFVIAIDTSASCKGELVKGFLKKTCQILRSKDSFFKKVNIHIIQCDSEIQQDIKITEEDDLDKFLKEGKLTGFGSTDFRPVFEYVDNLTKEGEFENLKGLIYFTDGYGVYPERMPEYDTAFVFLNDDYEAPKVPSWAIRVVLDEEEIKEKDK